MKILKQLTLALLLFFTTACADSKKENQLSELKSEIDAYLTQTIAFHNIPGLALAVMHKDEVVYESYFGKASLEDDILVDENTLFRVFSATKLITSTAIFQLIQQGDLHLDDTISKYLDHLPETWQEVQIKNLLSHSSGLPDFIRYESSLSDEALMAKLFEDDMEFDTGSQFRYNQTNYWLLAKVIEQITGMPFNKYVLKNQFQNVNNGVLFSSNAQEIIPNRATRYLFKSSTKTFEKTTNNDGVRGHAGNGLNITLKRFMEWNTQLDANTLLNEKTKAMMWSPFPFTNQKDQFLHGWGNYSVNHLDSYGFTGGNLAAFRKFTQNDLTIILLSNGYEIPAFDIIINDIARIVLPELKTKGVTLEEEVMRHVLNHELDKAKNAFRKLNEENPNSDFSNLKWNINGLGNSYAYEKELEKALHIFRFNTEANPEWWIAMASLAEFYEEQKDTVNAIQTYEKAILQNTSNEWDYNDFMKTKVDELKPN
ncbi:MAG: serine hydrolase [Bacteroidota bacterium]